MSLIDKKAQTIEESININNPQAKVTEVDKAVSEDDSKNNFQTIVSVEEAEKAVEDLCRRPDIGVQVFHEPGFDIEIDGVKYYYIFVEYGLSMAKKPIMDDDAITRVFVNSKDNSIYRAILDNDDNYRIGSKVTKDDIQGRVSELSYNDLVIKVGMDSKAILDKLGNGSATEDNNYGFIGWSEDNKYKYYYHDYVSFSLHTKVNVIDGTSVIDQINLDETKGIKKCMDIAAKIVGVKDWEIQNSTDYQDGENLYISFDGKNDKGKYVIGVRRTKDTTARWWWHFDPITFDYEVVQ